MDVVSQDTADADYSQTNIQVAGVDEADIIKTDGKYIYAVVKNNLFIIEIATSSNLSRIISTIKFKARPSDIYLSGDRLLVYGDDDANHISEKTVDSEALFIPRSFSESTFLKIFDISDRINPVLSREIAFEGRYSNSRLIGDYVYFVTETYQYNLDADWPVPMIRDNGRAINGKCAGDNCIMPEIFYFNMPYSDYAYTSIAAINIADNSEAVNSQTYLLSGSQNMYVSQNSIYIAYSEYLNEYDIMTDVMREIAYPKLTEKNRDKISKIEVIDEDILSSEEKKAKIRMVIDVYLSGLSAEEQEDFQNEIKNKIRNRYADISKELEKTVIHRIDIDKGKLTYKTSGRVAGQVLNQFSMDENNGYFRIATTKNRTWSQFADENQNVSYSNVYVLDNNMEVVGKVEGLAKDERIYSARFMQNRAYLVTFVQIDPLFVIDLTVPTAPRVLGELKVPGFSNYLHPYDDTTLIGIGKNTEKNQWGGIISTGLKISLFDVADPAQPREITAYSMGDQGSDSIALHDHKAFLFDRDKDLLVLPVTIMDKGNLDYYNKLVFSGAAVFTIKKDGISLKGKIDHSDGGKKASGDSWRGYAYYDNTVKRSLYIGEDLFTFSNNYLKINKLADLAEAGILKMTLDEPEENYEIIN
jgi:uncharacterized secreted protein with C-terminal beta-propeller domain